MEELTLKLNVQMGNLCQFLPQDKVADFAKMTQQELLDNTEKAVSRPIFHESKSSFGHDLRDIFYMQKKVNEGKQPEGIVLLFIHHIPGTLSLCYHTFFGILPGRQ